MRDHFQLSHHVGSRTPSSEGLVVVKLIAQSDCTLQVTFHGYKLAGCKCGQITHLAEIVPIIVRFQTRGSKERSFLRFVETR